MSQSKSTLSINEKYILHYIKNVTDTGKLFYQNDESLSIVLEMTPKSVKRLVYKLIQEGYLCKNDVNGKRYLSLSGKEFVPLAIYPNYKDINTKIYINENKKLKSENAKLLKDNDDLTLKLKEYELKVKALQDERDNLIITIEDLNREFPTHF